MPCQLCSSLDHVQEFHDTEILNWLANDPPKGGTNGRSYYAFKRRERKNYPGLRADVWWMMNHTVDRW